MRDFFTGLAARSFGAETGVRPRLASIFEPARNLAPVPMGFSVDREAEKERVATSDEGQRHKASPGLNTELLVQTEAPRASRDPQRYNPAQFSAHEHSEGNRVELVSSKIASEEQAPPRDAPRSSAPKPFSKNISAAAAVRPETSIETRAVAPPHPRAEMNEVEAGIQRPVHASRLPHNGSKLASVTTQEGGQERELAFARSADAIADLAARMRDAASMMNTAAAARLNRRDSGRETSAAAEPIVHVTIGRVEVRAATEAPREKRPRPASPVIGLDEYLRRTAQRGGQ